MDRRQFFKGAITTATASMIGGKAVHAEQNAPAAATVQERSSVRPPDDPWPGMKKLLAIADPQEWYSSSGYHHDSASHTLATVERLGRESGAWVTIIRTDMRLLTKESIAGFNVRNL